MCDSSAWNWESRQAKKPCVSAELWSLNPIISTYLIMVIIVPLISIMATTIMLIFVGLTAMIVTLELTATTGSTGKMWHFRLDLRFIVGIVHSQSWRMCNVTNHIPDDHFFWTVKGHVISQGFKGLSDLWFQAEITEKQVPLYIICYL